MSARFRHLKIKCAPSLRTSTGAGAGFSPDRVDALVWAFAELLVQPISNEGYFEWARQKAACLSPSRRPRQRWSMPSAPWNMRRNRSVWLERAERGDDGEDE
jgi:hypothetical protein